MTENFWLETVRIIGGILTLIITGYIAIKQVKQSRSQQELKEGQTKLKEEMNGHMSKLMAVSNEVHEQKGKQEAEAKIIIPAPAAPIELKIGKLEVEMKPPEQTPKQTPPPPPESPKTPK